MQQQQIQVVSRLLEQMKHGRPIIYMIYPEICMNGQWKQVALKNVYLEEALIIRIALLIPCLAAMITISQ
jgi:hypothetical protein